MLTRTTCKRILGLTALTITSLSLKSIMQPITPKKEPPSLKVRCVFVRGCRRRILNAKKEIRAMLKVGLASESAPRKLKDKTGFGDT